MPLTQSPAEQEHNPCSNCFFETECFDPLKGKESCNGYYPEDEGDDLK
jgi:hypothetical protein